MKKKRKWDDGTNELLPDGPVDETATIGSLEFDEILDEEVCCVQANRIPVI